MTDKGYPNLSHARFEKYLQKQTLTRLDELQTEIEGESDQIKAQIDSAKMKAKMYQEYSDPDWFVRVQRANRFAGRRLQLINRERTRRKRVRAEVNEQAEAERQARWERVFFATCKRILPPETMGKLIDLARLSMEEEE